MSKLGAEKLREMAAQAVEVRVSPVDLAPLNDMVLIRGLEGKDRKIGSIIIPDDVEGGTFPIVYEVLAAGPGRWSIDGTRRLTPSVAKGDHVLMKAGAEGHQVTLPGSGEKLVMVPEAAIACKVQVASLEVVR